MSVGNKKQALSWSELSKRKRTELELKPLRVESREAKNWSEIVNKNSAGNDRKDLQPLGTKEMQTKGWSEVAEDAKATDKVLKSMRTKESGTKKKELSPMRAEEKEDSFRRIIEKNQEGDIVALRSSDIFRKSSTEGNMNTLTPISVKTSAVESVQNISPIKNIKSERPNIKAKDSKIMSQEFESTSKVDSTTTASIQEEKKELGVLESLRSTHEEGMSSDEETMSLQAFRAVEKQQTISVENEADEKKKLVSSLLTNTFNDMKKRGIKVNLMNPKQEVAQMLFILNIKSTIIL